MLRVRVLGELELEAGGSRLDPPKGRGGRALLAWLALNPGLHPRSEVAGRFWPDVLEESARASLRAALSALRPALGEGARELSASREKVGFARDAELWVDALAFEELAGQGRLEEALALRRGELLAGLDGDWVYEARDVHRALVAEVLARAAVLAEDAGNLDRALSLSRERVAADPLSEAAHRELIRRLAASGDRGAALFAYSRLQQRLREELRVAPSAQTRALVERIRAGEGPAVTVTGAPMTEMPDAAGADWPPPVSPALLGRAPASAFVGRDEPAVGLRAAWECALGGDPGLVLVAGEPGIGKTRLLAELARAAAEDDGAAVLFGRCTEETLIPYQPFVEALDAYVAAGDPGRLAAEAGPGADELARLLPRLAPAPPQSTDGARYRLFEAVAALLRSGSSRWPMLVVLDDLHWADTPTLLLLAHLARQAGPARVLLAGAYRETELARTHPLAHALADLRRERLAGRVALRGLERDATAALLRERMGTEGHPALIDEVQLETGGNPFFIEELANHLAETGTGARTGIPEGVREVVGRRLDRLAPATDELLRLAAVVGRSFDPAVLEALSPGGGEGVLDALDEAVAAGLVREAPEEPGHYEFSHALIRDTLYDELTVARRVRLHGRVADALEAGSARRDDRYLAELAHHLFQAAPGGDARRAVRAARAAAQRADAQLAWEEAAAHYERALQALELEDAGDASAGSLRGELLEGLGEARMRSGERDAGRVAFRAAAVPAAERGDADALARAALGFGGVGVQVFAPDEETVALLERALAACSDGGDPARARLLARLAIERYYDPDPGVREALSAEAVAVAREAGDASALLAALNARHVALWDPEHLEQRLDIAREAIEVGVRTGEREAELQARNWLVTDLGELGDIAAFDAEAARHEALADELRLPAYRWYAPAWRAMRALAAGRLEDFGRFGQEAYEIGVAAQDENAGIVLEATRMFGHLARGDYHALDLSFVEARTAHPVTGLAWRSSLAWLRAERGELDAARAALAPIADHGVARLPLDANLLSLLAELGEACALLGERELGASVRARLEPFADRNTVSMRALGTWGHASHYLARLADLLGRTDEALALYRDALAGNERMDAGAFGARTALHHAALLARLGDPTARERAAAALAQTDALGLDGLLAQWRPRLTELVA